MDFGEVSTVYGPAAPGSLPIAGRIFTGFGMRREPARSPRMDARNGGVVMRAAVEVQIGPQPLNLSTSILLEILARAARGAAAR